MRDRYIFSIISFLFMSRWEIFNVCTEHFCEQCKTLNDLLKDAIF